MSNKNAEILKNAIDRLISVKNSVKDVEEYDIKSEFVELKNIDDPLKRMILYSSSPNFDMDCDVSLLSVGVYHLAYGFLKDGVIEVQRGSKNKYQISLESDIYRGDTMTSHWTKLIEYLAFICRKNQGEIPGLCSLNKDGNIRFDNFFKNIVKNDKNEIDYKRSRANCILEKSKFDSFQNAIIEEPYGKKVLYFLELNHTIGNFIPVPLGFNTGRSGEYAKWDFWDLTMKAIYDWYTGNNSKLKGFLNSDNCKKWLRKFGEGKKGWRKFVKQNNLQAYVYCNNKPKPFWSGHSFDKPYPTNETEWKLFITNFNKRALKRGKRISKIVEKTLIEIEKEGFDSWYANNYIS